MPNYCYYKMKIKGTKENCLLWLNKMKSYDEEFHFYRMFDPIVTDEEAGTDSDYSVILSGNCAWSLETCCRASGYSNGVDLFQKNTQDLDITMEAYSEESGMCFQEHYIYKHGKCVVDDCVDWESMYWDRALQSFEEFKKENDITDNDNITEDEFDEDGYRYSGGFKTWDFVI